MRTTRYVYYVCAILGLNIFLNLFFLGPVLDMMAHASSYSDDHDNDEWDGEDHDHDTDDGKGEKDNEGDRDDGDGNHSTDPREPENPDKPEKSDEPTPPTGSAEEEGPPSAFFDNSAPNLSPSRQAGGSVVLLRGSGNPEIVAVGPANQSNLAISALSEVSATFLRSQELSSVGLRALFFEYPWGKPVEDAVNALATVAPDMRVAFNTIYRFSGNSPRLYASSLVGASPMNGCRLPRSVKIGMIDGPVDTSHPALAAAHISSVSLLKKSERPALSGHGTAIAGLLVGQDPTGAIMGFAQGAELLNVEIFSRRWGRARADTERIVVALDYLLRRGFRVINMSFAGPYNAALDLVLQATADQGALMFAAVGNSGKQLLSHPAGAKSVVAVTAVDSSLRRFQSANYGSHVEFSAPGVDLYVAHPRGNRYVSGTSYAVPIVTAIAAGYVARGSPSLRKLRTKLSSSARDLGTPGQDSMFGWGLVRASGC